MQVMALAPFEISAGKNPIIPGMGVCDPHIKIFDDVAYLYAGHDHRSDSGEYDMREWQIWSSTDLRSWTLRAKVDPASFHIGPTRQAWAVDVAHRDGSFFLYFSIGNHGTGVARAPTPIGPWEDALGRPLLDGSLTGGRDYDPTVLIDADGAAYIVVGGPEWAYPGQGGYWIARLGDDMTSLAESPRRLIVDHPADDKASLNRIGNQYYLTYAGHVALSDTVYGPYRYVGNTAAALDHGSYFSWRGQLYNAFTIFDSSVWYRATGLCYAHRRNNGMLAVDSLVLEYGVHRYRAEWHRIEAEWFSACEDGLKVESARGGFVVRFASPGVISWDGVEGATACSNLLICGAASGTVPSVLHIVIDGESAGRLPVGPSGDIDTPFFFLESIPIPGVGRRLEIHVEPSTGASVELDWWRVT